MRSFLALLSLFLVAGCATGVPSAEPSPSPGDTPAPGPGFEVDSRFGTVRVYTGEDAAVPDVGALGVRFRLDGNCTYADAGDGALELLVWPEGHVRYNADTGTVWFLDVFGKQAVTFTSDQTLDLTVFPRSRDQGYVPLDPKDFVVPVDPSCRDDYVSLVTGVTVR